MRLWELSGWTTQCSNLIDERNEKVKRGFLVMCKKNGFSFFSYRPLLHSIGIDSCKVDCWICNCLWLSVTLVYKHHISHHKIVVAWQDALDSFRDHAAMYQLDFAVKIDEIYAGVLFGVLLAFETMKREAVRYAHPFVSVFPSSGVQCLSGSSDSQ